MQWLPRRETCAPWLFFGLGISLIHWHYPVIDDLLHARSWSFFLFPHSFAAQAFFMGLVILALLPASGLCFITGWGLRRRASWARWTGLFPCVYLLFGFPWLTIIGALGLYLLWKQPFESASRQGADFWSPQRQSIWFAIVAVPGWVVARHGIGVFETYSRRIGLPERDTDHTAILVLLLLIWLHIVLHECGHALAAWKVGFRLKAFGIGPFALHKDHRGYHFRFEWGRLLLSGGYMGAVPASHQGIWFKQTLIVAAGPFASFAAGAAFVLVFFLLPGTPLARYWPDVAIGSLLGFYIGAINLLPLGYTDGTMLLHLILRTRRGEELIARILHSQNRQADEERQTAGDYQGSVALRRAALQRLLEQGGADPSRLADEYVGLGRMEVAAQQWREAEQHLRQALDLLANGVPDVSLESTCWACLHRVYLYQQDFSGAEGAYRKALAANESLLPRFSDRVDQLTLHLSIAELHSHAHAFEPALAETERALAGFPGHPQYRLLKGRLLSIRAHSALQSGNVALGLAAADEAAGIFRSDDNADGAAAPHHLGILGWSLWEGGHADRALLRVTDCVRLLELRGAMHLAAQFRLCLAGVLRVEGRPAEAACVLPELERVGRDLRKEYVGLRGTIRQKAGRWQEALEDASEALWLTLEDTPGDELAIALARSALAEAFLDAGRLQDAEATAGQAYQALTAVGHPERAATCMTLALIGWQKEQSTGVYFDEGLRVWEEAPLVLAATKARFLESSAERLEKAGLPVEAAQCLAAAEAHWRTLGLCDRARNRGAVASRLENESTQMEHSMPAG